MVRKGIIPLFLLLAGVLLAACGQNQASPTQQTGMANPASVYCEQNGGSLELRQDASGGVAGMCTFPDGSECDEWAYFRGECKPGGTSTTAEAIETLAAGLRLAYFKGGQIMFWTAQSGARALVKADSEQIRISEDGQVLAYLGSDSNGVFGLYGVNTDGTNPHMLVALEHLQNTQPASQIVSFDFAPGGHTVFFVTDQYDLQRVDMDGGAPESILGPGRGGFFSFSPDGEWMVLYHPNELVLAHPDGSAASPVFQYPPEFSFTMVGPQIVWKGDSSGFSMVSASAPQGEPDSMTVWFILVAGQPVKQMSYAGPYGANLSPDGRSVVYLTFQHEPVDVHIVTPDGKDTPCGTYSSHTYPAINFMGWAPDSQSFLLNLSSDARLMDPHLCSAGKSPVKLTDTGHAYPIVWLDEQRILFISDDSLRLQRTGSPSVVLDQVSSSGFDFTILKP
jgi:putative hemolysin